MVCQASICRLGEALAEPNKAYCCWVSLRFTQPTRTLIFSFDAALGWFLQKKFRKDLSLDRR